VETVAISGRADSRWRALAARDRTADGRFVYAVRTTGIYCRPSCGARRPRPENVRFYRTGSDAERAGFRACRRCRPDRSVSKTGETIAELCRYLETANETPALEVLAARAGLSPWHLHRLFKSATGLTPKAYAASRRAERMRAALGRGAPVTRAVYEAGYGSGSRFYERADGILGMTPGKFRAGGQGETIRYAFGRCSAGLLLVAEAGRGICAVALGSSRAGLVKELRLRFPEAKVAGADRAFAGTVAKVVRFIDKPGRGASLPLDLRGTVFQRRVWEELRKIPPGKTASYSELARRLKAPRSVRAVASACAANPVAVLVPCHRAVRSDGSLAGYRWGLERKRALLAAEGRKRRKT